MYAVRTSREKRRVAMPCAVLAALLFKYVEQPVFPLFSTTDRVRDRLGILADSFVSPWRYYVGVERRTSSI